MPLYLPPKLGGGTCAIAYCDRCRRKVYYDELEPDGDTPNLRVCRPCNDLQDPYRLPKRKTENISLKNPRPGDLLTLDNSTVLATQYNDDIIFPPNLTLE